VTRPRVSFRLRLALLYAVLFVVAGAALLAVNYSLLSAHLPQQVTVLSTQGQVAGQAGPAEAGGLTVLVDPPSNSSGPPGSGALVVQGNGSVPGGVPAGAPDLAGPAGAPAPAGGPATGPTWTSFANAVSDVSVTTYRAEVLSQLVRESAAALGAMAVLAVVLGWYAARRVLRPVHEITRTAQRLGEGSLDERLTVTGPRDELRELGDTFNAMLDRLQAAFGRERRLMANISHELRTPLANQRMALEVGLADEGLGAAELRRLGETALSQNLRTQRLIERLLLLASAQESTAQPAETVDLAQVARDAVHQLGAGDQLPADLQIRMELDPATVQGDGMLLERLVGNLVENAVRHNVPGGWIQVRAGSDPANHQTWLEVANSGAVVPPDVVPGLFEPFRRRGGDRVHSDRGVGLGLALVSAIVGRHHGTVTTAAVDGGGLAVRVSLPA